VAASPSAPPNTPSAPKPPDPLDLALAEAYANLRAAYEELGEDPPELVGMGLRDRGVAAAEASLEPAVPELSDPYRPTTGPFAGWKVSDYEGTGRPRPRWWLPTVVE
jgi:hypothetical protein